VTAALPFGADGPEAPVTARSAWCKSCGHCRRNYGTSQWEALPIVTALAPASVQAHLSVPAAWTVELRRCACGSVLAARSR
jgi:hypothetical protein